MLLSKEVSKTLIGYWAVLDQIFFVKIRAKPQNRSLIQVYPPTSDSSEGDIDAFYGDLDITVEYGNSQEVVVVMGDLNAKVGRRKCQDIVGLHGLGVRNERWTEWCEQNEQVFLNTWFEHHPQNLWTWKTLTAQTKTRLNILQ